MTVHPKYSPHSQFSPLWTVCAQALNTPQLHCARCLPFLFLVVLIGTELLPVIEVVQFGVYHVSEFLRNKMTALIGEDVHIHCYIGMNHKMLTITGLYFY